ncbi:TlyA family RNA methyltransferase [Bifidobacterium tibiigranuli]|uniref:TlyA family RNA methyltransferase n=1 Tax=Bifidobacterium tibiigranuli TaxID=2172043 RepID=UPI0026EC54A3|nr:TlyA family RNA methyltransferase [Bifidobacterium tibiigranuli]MCI2185280.1 TlyA family RNA methyltransferase [Bifidobacterium tibiigranuli]MCI2203745.1 TlyA family RNA methyltransferase [Bifidobacterium tibiigranuli]
MASFKLLPADNARGHNGARSQMHHHAQSGQFGLDFGAYSSPNDDSGDNGSSNGGNGGNTASSAQTCRLDVALVECGLVTTRSKAQTLIRSGHVLVNGAAARKASEPVHSGDNLRVDKGEDYASRGAYKLVGAFEAFASVGLPSPQGLRCLDIGASTGGFCDVLLRRGADKVIALDVGHGQLDPRIAADPRIIEMSGVNIREVMPGDLPFAPHMVVTDVSFVSLTYVIPVIARLAAPGAHAVLLVKPQFEVGKGRLGKNGVVEDPALREQALRTVIGCAQEHGFEVCGHCVSPIAGGAGNIEYLLYACLRSAAAPGIR